MGHEFVGRVTEVGTGVTDLKPGDRVIGMAGRGCGECEACQEGHYNWCEQLKVIGGHIPGALAEELTLPAEQFLVIPEWIPDDQAALIEVGAVGMHTIKRHPGSVEGKSCLVLGAGPVGLLGAMAFLLRGCATTIVARSPATTPNARLAQAIGARYVSSREVPIQELGPFDVIYEAAGAPLAAFEALVSLAPNGVCILTGVPPAGEMVQFDGGRVMRNLVLQNQVILGTVNASRDSFAGAISMLGDMNRKWPESLRGLITDRHPLEAYADLLFAKPQGIKSIMVL